MAKNNKTGNGLKWLVGGTIVAGSLAFLFSKLSKQNTTVINPPLPPNQVPQQVTFEDLGQTAIVIDEQPITVPGKIKGRYHNLNGCM